MDRAISIMYKFFAIFFFFMVIVLGSMLAITSHVLDRVSLLDASLFAVGCTLAGLAFKDLCKYLFYKNR